MRPTTGLGKWGFQRGSPGVPPQPGGDVSLKCHPAVRALPPGRAVPAARGSPPVTPLCSPGYLPHQVPSCHRGWLPAVPDAWEATMWAGQGQWKGSFVQLGGGSSSCASWKVTCQLRKLCHMVAFLCHLVIQRLLVLRKEELR